MKQLKPEEEIDEDWSDWYTEPYEPTEETEIDNDMRPYDPEDEKLGTARLGRKWDAYLNNEELDGPTVTVSSARTERIRKKADHRDCEDFFGNILDLEPQCYEPEFVDYLVDSDALSIKRVFSDGGAMVSEYRVRYLGGEFNTLARTLTVYDTDLLRDGIRGFYDERKKVRLKETMKKAGVVAAVGLGVIALVTGLSVGLTRKGADMVHQAKKWEKLHPSKKITTIPWTTIEKAGGKTIIFAGEYYLVIGAGIYLLVRRRRSYL